jgi:hypothetical protein
MPANTGGTQDPYKNVDPNGLQTTATGAAALSFVVLAADGATGGPMESLLGLGTHSPQVVTAGLSLAHLSRVDLFSVGLLLLGASILLNIASLVIRRQRCREDFLLESRQDSNLK